MPKYNETTTVDTTDVTRYEYAHRVELSNPLGGMPSLTFRTSWVDLDNETGVETQGEFYRSLSDAYVPNETFDVVDADGNVVGQSTYEVLFASLYSLFFHLAAKEDS